MSNDNEMFEKGPKQISKEEAQRWLEYCNVIDRLKQNKDFQILMNVYCHSEIMRNTSLYVTPQITMSVNKQQLRDDILENMISCARFRNYINVEIDQIRNMAQNTLDAYNEEESE